MVRLNDIRLSNESVLDLPTLETPPWLLHSGDHSTSIGSLQSSRQLDEASRQAALALKINADHETLMLAMQRLEDALDAKGPGEPDPLCPRYVSAVRALEDAWRRHVASAESPEELFAESDLACPTIFYRLKRLRREHTDILHQATALRQQVERADRRARGSFRTICQESAALLEAVCHHLELEADVVFETLFIDIGTGD
jgi:hypothetical protein